MKNKLFKFFVLFISIVLIVSSAVPVSAEERESKKIINGIISSNSFDAQSFINGKLVNNVGTGAEWYIMALSQQGKYDFSSYEKALLKYLSENKVYSATSRQKYALALISIGSGNKYIYSTLNDSIGKQGIMSYIFGLHLLNNGYKSNEYTKDAVKNKILSMQLADGGWAVSGNNGDTDVTAMTLCALAPFYKNDEKVKTAVNSAINLLSEKQQPDGDFGSYGVNCAESTAQVLVALSCLGINCEKDSRFIKNGKTVFDGIKKYATDGGFSHTQGGGYNETATVQVFYSAVAFERLVNGKGSFFIFDNKNPSILDTSVSENENKEPVTEKNTEVSNETVTEIQTDNVTEDITEKAETVSDISVSENLTDEKITEENTADEATEKVPDKGEKNKFGYKIYSCIGIFAAAIILCVILFVKKKRNKKIFIMIFAAAILLSGVIFAVNITSANDYYTKTESKNAVGSVSLSIRCDALGEDNKYILSETEVEIADGDTVYTVLLEATAKNKIHLEKSGSNNSVYIKGIANIYEFDYGELSGWMYYVNGEEANVSCGAYALKDGDTVEFIYTRNMGEDIEATRK